MKYIKIEGVMGFNIEPDDPKEAIDISREVVQRMLEIIEEDGRVGICASWELNDGPLGIPSDDDSGLLKMLAVPTHKDGSTTVEHALFEFGGRESDEPDNEYSAVGIEMVVRAREAQMGNAQGEESPQT